MLAIDPASLNRFVAEIPLREDSLFVTDSAAGRRSGGLPEVPGRVFDLPMQELAKTIQGGRPNMIALGAIAKMIGLSEASIDSVLEKILSSKGPDIIETSRVCVQAGYAAGADLPAFDVWSVRLLFALFLALEWTEFFLHLKELVCS